MFQEAIESSRGFSLPELQRNISLESYLDDINEWLGWTPRENASSNVIYHRIAIFYFILNQPSLKHLHPSSTPENLKEPMIWLSEWLLRYAKTLGRFLDSSRSINEQVNSSRAISSLDLDPSPESTTPLVIVNPADARFEGQRAIGEESWLTAKHVEWRVTEILGDITYEDRFPGGVFMHATLGANDSHHIHTLVSRTVLENTVMPSQAAFNVMVKVSKNGEAAGIDFRGSIDTPGYRMTLAHGLILLDTEVGLVAVLPVGIAQVDSVVITAQPG
ncbi:hypothetical protein ABVK25_007653 [Lepraria finkii]|uniref:Uncharacterized protein n=1 Tax=Lepraria finkii TaxID=1340010 RepID=A0ABR4B2S3_9LECA